jgi:hypothetical protein
VVAENRKNIVGSRKSSAGSGKGIPGEGRAASGMGRPGVPRECHLAFFLPDIATRLPTRSAAWDRDEWDIAMGDGTVYRLFVERDVGQWFLEGVFD